MINLSKILNLKEGEGKIIIFPMIYSFFIGASIAFFVTSSTSLFLSSFEREYLPISFIAAGILVWIIGKLLKQLQDKLEFSKSLPAGLSFLLITVIVLLVLYKLFENVIIIFVLYAWIRVFAYIHAVTFWSLAGRLFSLRQAKRVFGLITGGEVFASIISFFSVPILLKFIQTSDLLLISGAFLAFGFLFLLFIVKRFNIELSVKKAVKKVEKKEQINFSKSRYFKLFFLIAFIPIFAQFFVDFIFQAQAKIEFPDREKLTAFVGVFFGLSSIVEFVLKTFISGRLLSQYGVKLGLIAFPVVLLISFLLASVFGLFFGAAGLFFSFVTLGRLFTRAVRTSFNDPATQILYQPLPAAQRLTFQNKIESGPKAYASIVAGIILLVFAQIPNVSLVFFAAFLLGVTAFWLKLSIETFKEYKIKIRSVLKITKQENELSVREKIFQFLKSKKEKSYGVGFFMNVINKKNIPEKKDYKLKELVKFANSNNPEDRIIATQNLTRFSIYKTEKLFIKLLTDDDYDVRSLAIKTVGESKQKELFDYLLNNIKLNDYQEAVSQAILRIGNYILPDVIRMFSSLDYDTNLQLKIIDLFKETKTEIAIEFLRKLMNYPNRLIKEKALQALAYMNYNVTKQEAIKINLLLEEKINAFVYLAASILDLKKSDKLKLIVEELENKKQRQKGNVFVILSVLYDKNAIDLIKNNLDTGDENSKGFALEVADTVISDIQKDLLLPLFESETNLEIVRRYRFDFPQEKLSIEKRIIDIVNADIATIGILVKGETIKQLVNYQNSEIINVLKTNMMHPIEYLREIAGFLLFQMDVEAFNDIVYKNQFKKKFLKYLSDKINMVSKGGNMLIYEKIDVLKTLSPFDNLDFLQLFLLATESSEKAISQGEKLLLEFDNYKDIYIVIAGQFFDGHNNYYQGDIFTPYLCPEKKISQFEAIEPSLILKTPLYNLNSVILNNYNFAKKIIINTLDKTA